MSQSNKEKKKLWMQECATSVNLSLKHGSRTAATSLTIAICNDASACCDMEVEAIARRVYQVQWQDTVSATSFKILDARSKCMQEVLKQMRGQAMQFMTKIDLAQLHSDYQKEVMNVYHQFADPKTVRNCVPMTIIQYQAILLQTAKYLCFHVINFDESIIKPAMAENWRFGFQV